MSNPQKLDDDEAVFGPTAADQPPAEPSEAAALVQQVRHALSRQAEPMRYAALDYPVTAVPMARALEVLDGIEKSLAPAPQPAADTDTEVQWGVRGMVAGRVVIEGPMSKFQAEGHLGERGASTFRTSAVVSRTATYTLWEDAT